jgi:hypothetical protein
MESAQQLRPYGVGIFSGYKEDNNEPDDYSCMSESFLSELKDVDILSDPGDNFMLLGNQLLVLSATIKWLTRQLRLKTLELHPHQSDSCLPLIAKLINSMEARLIEIHERQMKQISSWNNK